MATSMKKDVMIPCTEVGSLWAVASDPVGVLVVLLLFAVTQIECATNLPSENTEGFGNFRAERVFRTVVDSHVTLLIEPSASFPTAFMASGLESISFRLRS